MPPYNTKPTRKAASVGMFDGVHIGHRMLVSLVADEARRRDQTPVIFSFLSHPLSLLHPTASPKLLTTVGQREKLLREAGAEEVVFLKFDQKLRNLTAEEFIRDLHTCYQVDTLTVGFNHRFGRDRSSGFEDYVAYGEKYGMEIIQTPELTLEGIDTPVSSSAIRTALANGNIMKANTMLGRRFTVEGHVVTGKRLGRTIGFPTANISPLSEQLILPATGVYAVDVTICNGKTYRGMLNIGRRPTIDRQNAPISIETHLIGFHGDLYGQTISASFIARLRDEMPFPTLAALQARLSADRDMAVTF